MCCSAGCQMQSKHEQIVNYQLMACARIQYTGQSIEFDGRQDYCQRTPSHQTRKESKKRYSFCCIRNVLFWPQKPSFRMSCIFFYFTDLYSSISGQKPLFSPSVIFGAFMYFTLFYFFGQLIEDKANLVLAFFCNLSAKFGNPLFKPILQIHT